MSDDWHLSRGWGGEPPDFDCDCPVEPCGFINPKNYVPGCPYHNMTKTIRGGHRAEDCTVEATR